MSGFYKMHRGWMDNPVFKSEPFTEREAWLWLIENAAWKPRQYRIGAKVIDLDRGQLAASLRFMAEAWGWGKNRVSRFLSTLKSALMIEAKSALKTGQSETMITICNYSVYQASDESGGTGAGHLRDSGGTDAGQNKEGKEVKEKKHSVIPPDQADGFAAFWAAYPRKVAKDAAAKAYRSAIKKTFPETILAGLHRYAEQCKGKEAQFIAHAATWLNQGRWQDEDTLQPEDSKPIAFDPEEVKRRALAQRQAGRASPGQAPMLGKKSPGPNDGGNHLNPWTAEGAKA